MPAHVDDEHTIQYIEDNQEYEFIEEDIEEVMVDDDVDIDDGYELDGDEPQHQQQQQRPVIDYINVEEQIDGYYTIEIEDDEYGKDSIIA